MTLEIVPAYDRKEEIKELFAEYTDMLVKTDPVFAKYLAIQGYDDELKDLEKKYGMPDGRLYLAIWEGKPAGCIALRRLTGENCEMKRLYVRPAFQGHGIGRALAEKIIEEAKNAGYSHMFLDTVPVLADAVRRYRKMGFYETECYNDSPVETTLFMEYDLQALCLAPACKIHITSRRST